MGCHCEEGATPPTWQSHFGPAHRAPNEIPTVATLPRNDRTSPCPPIAAPFRFKPPACRLIQISVRSVNGTRRAGLTLPYGLGR